jgi:hypothetical protein
MAEPKNKNRLLSKSYFQDLTHLSNPIPSRACVLYGSRGDLQFPEEIPGGNGQKTNAYQTR